MSKFEIPAFVSSLIEENEQMTVEIAWLRKQVRQLTSDFWNLKLRVLFEEEVLFRSDLLRREEGEIAHLSVSCLTEEESIKTVSFLRPILDQLASLRFDTAVFSRIQRIKSGDLPADDFRVEVVKGFFQSTLDDANSKFDQLYVSVASMQRTALSKNVFASLVLDCYTQIIALCRTMNALHFEKIEVDAEKWILVDK
jgi:hypothetical protein